MKSGLKKLVVKMAVIFALFGITLEVGAQTVSACCWWWRPRCRPIYIYYPPCPKPAPKPVVPKKIEAPTVYTLVAGSNRISGTGLPNHYIGLTLKTKAGATINYPIAFKIDSAGNFDFPINHVFQLGDTISIYQYLGTPGKKTELSDTVTLGVYTF